MLLPSAGPVPQKVQKSATPTEHRGTAHVLVVDDEETVRNFVSQVLERHGYTVTVCEDGHEGVELVRENPELYDLVILDLIMPVLSGEDAFYRMRECSPDLKVILSSGFTKQRVSESLIRGGAVGFIGKPFHIDELLTLVSRFTG